MTLNPPKWAATGLLYPPAGRRTRWCVIVPSCPRCGYQHQHAIDEFARTILRSPSCRPSSTYEVHVLVVLPQAVQA